MAGTSWPTFTAGNKIRASEVESKFDWIEGSVVPMSGGNKTTGVYDLGETGTRWNYGYINHPVSNDLNLAVQAIAPTLSADAGLLFTKDVGSRAELHWKDEGGNEKQLTSLGNLLLASNFYIGSFDRDTTVASGAQTITGLGFSPSVVIFLSSVDSTSRFCVGVDKGTSTSRFNKRTPFAGTADLWGGDTSNSLDDSGFTAYYRGYISSLDSNGFTIAWTKTNSPTGVMSIYFVAIK